MIDWMLDVFLHLVAIVIISSAIAISVGLSLLFTGWIWLGVENVWSAIF